MASSTPLDPGELLAHARFLSGLAACLVRDPASADDVVQETYLAALRHPPETRQGLRGWLATVARNAARGLHRERARRDRRERLVARPEGALSAQDVAEREQARTLLVAAVLRLDEPHRDVVLLRFYEGLPPREVARRLDVPVETVRTRTRRAVDRLRLDLDREHGERRWVPALLWLAPAAPSTVGASSSLVGTALVMSTQTKLLGAVAAVLLLLLGAAGLGWLGAADPAPSRVAAELPAESRASEPDAPAAELEGASRRERRSESAAVGPEDDSLTRSARPLGVLRGVVLSGRTHDPVAGARVTVRPTRGGQPSGDALSEPAPDPRSASTDARGRFLIEGLPAGAWAVLVEHAQEGRDETVAAAGPDPTWALCYLMPDDPTKRVLEVRVATADGAPLAGAEVVAKAEVRRTDAEGRTRFADFGLGAEVRSRYAEGRITVRAADTMVDVPFRYDLGLGRPGPHVLEVRLAPGRIEGNVRVPAGASPGGRVVVATFGTTGATFEAVVAADGRFRTSDTLPEGRYAVDVRSSDGLRLEPNLAVGGSSPRTADVRWGAATEVQLDLVTGGTVKGRVRDASGAPLPGARVSLSPTGRRSASGESTMAGSALAGLGSQGLDPPVDPSLVRRTTTDPDGRYVLVGLSPGECRVDVAGPGGYASERLTGVRVEDGRTSELDHVLGRAGALEVVLATGGFVELRRSGEPALAVSVGFLEESRGAATVTGLAPGDWTLLQRGYDSTEAAIPLATFAIRAGETTYLDATQRGEARVRVQILDGGRPVVGARVDGGGLAFTTLVTDDEGRASWAMPTEDPGATRLVRLSAVASDVPGLVARFPSSPDEVRLDLPTSRLLVRAVDAAGRGVPGAEVRVSPVGGSRSERWSLKGPFSARTDSVGRATVRGLPAGDHEVRVVFSSGALATNRVAVDGDSVETVLSEPPSGRVRVRVIDPQGRPAPDVPVGLLVLAKDRDPGVSDPQRWQKAVPHHGEGLRTGPDGTCLVSGVAPGWAQVGAWVMDSRGTTLSNGTRVVEVVAGETHDVEVRLAKTAH